MYGILIANRGEIAIRIARAVTRCGLQPTVAYPADDASSLHVLLAERSVPLPGRGAAAYLDQQALISAAKQAGCDAIHPGYGFLSENADFARLCAISGVTFIGPTPEILELFGDKARARGLAEELGVPVLPGTKQPTTLGEAQAFMRDHGPVMLKALAGGGGRGMRAVVQAEDMEAAYERCQSEALQAFGASELYVEKLLTDARHIEVQVIGDGSGRVTHLWERDCSIQRRHQKVLEIAPSPNLCSGLRDRIIAAAVLMAQRVEYRSLGTFEFLVSGDEFWFMEANPRLQVEHTITEEITGIDLVAAQISIAQGRTLADLSLQEAPARHGFAIQARINLEVIGADGTVSPQTGKISEVRAPSGPGVRFDHYAYAGYTTSLAYDSLIGKVIVRGADYLRAVELLTQALRETRIDGVGTNLPFLRAIAASAAFRKGDLDTTFVSAQLPDLLANSVNDLQLVAKSAGPGSAAVLHEGHDAVQPGIPVVAPMHGVVIRIAVAPTAHVRIGDPLFVLEAMKMEHVIAADRSGRVVSIAVTEGMSVVEQQTLLRLEEGDSADKPEREIPGLPGDQDAGWQPEIEELIKRKAAAAALGGAAKIERQKSQGKLTARERIDQVLDPETFEEIGALSAFSRYDEHGELISLTPANFIAGTGAIAGRTVMLGVDDFTIRAGSGDAARHEKQIFVEDYAREMRMPMVRLLDGASGGGSVTIAQEAGYQYLPVNPGWDAVVDLLSLTPVVAAALGPTVGLGAARLAMSHLSIMVEGIGQIFTAGPPIVEASTGERLDKEALGGASVHRASGVVDRIVASEQEAFNAIRAFLSYLPSSVFELPPVVVNADPADRREEELLRAIPRNPRAAYRLAPIMAAIFDHGSLFPYASYGDGTFTGLARLNGYPIGLVASDPKQGATMSVEGAQAMTRLIDLCDTFHLPLVSLTDQGGVSIGHAAELRGSIRHGVRAISAVYQARVPQAELILRRVFGVGGAGMVNRHRPGRSWAWPSGNWGSLPAKGGIEAAFRARLDEVEDRAGEIERIQRELERVGSPFRTAEHFAIQDIIDPRDSRPLLCAWVGQAYRLLPEQLGRPSFGLRP